MVDPNGESGRTRTGARCLPSTAALPLSYGSVLSAAEETGPAFPLCRRSVIEKTREGW